MFCANCGQQINDEARFCPHCGTATLVEQPHTNSDFSYQNETVYQNPPSSAKPIALPTTLLPMLTTIVPAALYVLGLITAETTLFTSICNIMAVVLLFADRIVVGQMGYKIGWGWVVAGIFVSPVYFFQRSKVVGDSYSYTIINLVWYAVTFLIGFIPAFVASYNMYR